MAVYVAQFSSAFTINPLIDCVGQAARTRSNKESVLVFFKLELVPASPPPHLSRPLPGCTANPNHVRALLNVLIDSVELSLICYSQSRTITHQLKPVLVLKLCFTLRKLSM